MKFQAALVFCATLLLIAIVGCGGSPKSSSTNPAASDPPTTSASNPGSSSSASPGTSGSSSGSSSSGGSSGGSQGAAAYAYVGTANSSTAGIYGFSIAADGSASSVSGSPVSGPSSYVLTNSAFVFATDGHNIAGYARASDGSLSSSSSLFAVLGSGPQTWAIQAMSLDHSGQTLYAMENAGSDDIYYFFFNIGSDGKLANIGKIGPNVDYGSPLVFSSDNNYAYGFGCFHADWDLTGFKRNADGTLVQLGSALTNTAIPAFAGPPTTQMYCPIAEAVSKTGYLAVGEARLGTQASGLAIFKINGDGSLALVTNSTTANLLPSVNAMKFDPNGQYLALAGNGGIQMYQLTSSGTVVPVGGIQAGGANYLSLQWDTTNHLYAGSASGLSIFTSSQGILTPAAGSPHAAGPGASLTVLPLQ